MPYFIYRVNSPTSLEHLETKERYQEAKQLVRAQRQSIEPGADYTVRMIFAKTTVEAEKLLSTPRDERVIGED